MFYKILLQASKVWRMQVIFGKKGRSDGHISIVLNTIQIPRNCFCDGEGGVVRWINTISSLRAFHLKFNLFLIF